MTVYVDEEHLQKIMNQASEVSDRYISSNETVFNNVVMIEKIVDKVPVEFFHITTHTSNPKMKSVPIPNAKIYLVVYNNVDEAVTIITITVTSTPANTHLVKRQASYPTSSINSNHTVGMVSNDDTTLTMV